MSTTTLLPDDARRLPPALYADIRRLVDILLGDDDAQRAHVFRYFCQEAYHEVVEYVMHELYLVAMETTDARCCARVLDTHRRVVPTALAAARRSVYRHAAILAEECSGASPGCTASSSTPAAADVVAGHRSPT
ncbi:MAG: hypothetical protein JNM56_34200 [Planctomycetia bacterium]|nr:hypothetical protein [Planctomycetia bacterium]